MHADEIHASLHPLEVKVLLALGEQGEATDRELIQQGVTTEDHIRTVVEWQRHKGGLEVVRQEELELAELTPAGRHYLEHGIPELVLMERLRSAGGELTMAELRQAPGVAREEAGSAIGALRQAGLMEPLEGGRVRLADGDATPFQLKREAVMRLAEQGRTPLEELPPELQEVIRAGSRKRGKARGIFRLVRELTRTLRLTPTGLEVARRIREAGLTGEEVNVLTPEMLRDGSWEHTTFRRYNIDIAPPRQVTGKRNPYRSFLDQVQEKLLSLGFEEMSGPLVESEFWNLDALFMPQFHPARQIHDVYHVAEPSHARDLPEPQATRVAEAHEHGGGTGSLGWRYPFDRERTRRLVLRSQGTSLSARWLSRARYPGKYFAMARCFRYDQVDATHAPDFFQIEGIVLSPTITFRELLGLLKVFAEEVARAREIRYVPAYFPFTEPSVEVHMRHPRVGWMELGGAGIFRPEVCQPQGVPPEVPVLAWGLGLDRMAMVALGINDIRDLFSTDLSFIRGRVAPLEHRAPLER